MRFLLSVMIAIFTSAAMASDVFIEAEPIEKHPPKYPKSALFDSKEGWVILSYVVDKDGSVIAPIVEDSTGVEAFEREALKAIKRWKYKPASLNGKPAQQCKANAKMSFSIHEKEPGATRKFTRLYKRVSALLANQDIENAKKELAKLEEMSSWNLYEDAWYSLLKAQFDQIEGDYDAMLINVRRAVAYEGIYLPESSYRKALALLFQLQMNQNQYIEALNTFSTLQAVENSEAEIASINDSATKLKAQLESNEVLKVPAQLNQSGLWRVDLARRSISFGETDENLTEFELRCNRRHQTFSIKTDQTWNIPEGWGYCSIYVKGKPGTNFNFYLMPEEKNLRASAP